MSNIELTVPRGYAEMTEKQIRYVAKLQASGQSEETIRVKCFLRFADIRPITGTDTVYWFVKPNLKGFFSMKVEEVMYFADKMDWLTRQYNGIKPAQKVAGLHPCDHLLRDTTFLQYLDAENYFQAYLFTNKAEYLYKLMATLYQSGDKYSNNATAKLAKRIQRRASATELQMATMWIVGVKEHFANKFKDLFVQSAFTESDAEPPKMYEIIRSQIRLLSGGDITKENAVLASKTWTALDELNEKCREARQQAS